MATFAVSRGVTKPKKGRLDVSSIADSGKVRKSPLVIGETVSISPRGVRVRLKLATGQPKHLEDCKRGKITEFSNSAARRLREALWSLSIPDSICLGVTLTVPWHAYDFEPLMGDWRDCFHRFGVSFRRAYPSSGLIFRNELQRRGAPHCHAVVYIAACDVPLLARSQTEAQMLRRFVDCVPSNVYEAGDCECAMRLRRQELTNSIKGLWLRSVGRCLHGGRLSDFRLHGVTVDHLDPNDCGNLYRYLADHASKHKRDQLGYAGKQWGILNRTAFSTSQVEGLSFDSPRHKVYFFRMLRKLTRYTIDRSIGSKWAETHPYKSSSHPEWWFIKGGVWHTTPPFGCVHKGGHRRVGHIFTSGGSDTLLRAFRFAQQLAREATR